MSMPSELACAKDAAVAAGEKVMEFYGKSGFSLKKDRTEVTEADMASNEILISRLSSFGYQIISEESDENALPGADGKKCWIIDPLDGTKDFISGGEDFAVMVGMASSLQPVLGVVYLPAKKTLFYAEKKKGAFVEAGGRTAGLAVSAVSSLPNFRLIASKNHFSETDAKFRDFFGGASFSRRGSIGVKLSEIAAGNAEFYWNFDGLSVWDACAPQAILEEAGGEVFDLSGKRLECASIRFNRGILATNGKCKDEILKLADSFLAKTQNDGIMEGKVIWITGLAGSGKTTIAKEVYARLKPAFPNTVHLDGDSMREVLGNVHGHTIGDRKATAYIYARLASMLAKQGINAIVSTISLFHEIHAYNAAHNRHYYEILVDVDKGELLRRNKKMLYNGEQKGVMGVDQQPEFPKNPSLVLRNNNDGDLKKNVEKIINLVKGV